MRLLQLAITIIIAIQSTAVLASTLTTPKYIVTISVNCEEGNVTCDKVTYKGVSKKTGDSIELKGSTWHTKCSDGVTPCRFLGYKFKNGNITYNVLESGMLQVIQGDSKVLLEESGTWKY